MFFVYILRSDRFGIFYVGHTEDVVQRIREHQTGRSHFTASRGPWKLVHLEVFSTRAEAMKREQEIKGRKSKRYIEKLVKSKCCAWKALVDLKDVEVG